MADVWVMGEMLVEIMRSKKNIGLDQMDIFKGPFPSGAPAIFIDTVSRLGHSAGIIGGVGKDDFGKCLLGRLKKDGVDCSKVIESTTKPTAVAFVTYFSDGSRKFIFHIANTPAVDAKAPDIEDLRGVKFFHVMGCSLMTDDTFSKEIVKTVYLAKELGAKISFDPNVRMELLHEETTLSVVKEVLANTDIFMPSISELLFLSGEKSVEEAINSCFDNQNVEIVVLKDGERGSKIYTRTEVITMGIYPTVALDPTGAGDSYDAAFLCGLLENKSVEESAKMATAAASINIGAFGPMEGAISTVNIESVIRKNNG